MDGFGIGGRDTVLCDGGTARFFVEDLGESLTSLCWSANRPSPRVGDVWLSQSHQVTTS